MTPRILAATAGAAVTLAALVTGIWIYMTRDWTLKPGRRLAP
jgi:hypothetical protein